MRHALLQCFETAPLNCSPVEASFAAGVDTPIPRDVRKTVAEGTSIKRPLRLREMIRALRESEGGAVAIPEEGIVTALGRLASRGLFTEPTSATAAAALDRLRASGAIATNEKTVAVLTGTGLKAASTVAELLSGAS